MVRTRKQKEAPPKVDKIVQKKAARSKNIRKADKRKAPPPVQATRRSTRVSKQFVPFSAAEATKKKTTTARAVARSARRRAASVHRARSRSVQRAALARKRAPPKTEKKPSAKMPKAPKDKNASLQKRDFIENLKVNPLLFGPESKVARTVVSAAASTRLAIRYVLQRDVKALQKLVNDRKKFPSDGFEYGYAFEDCTVPETLAALTEDRKMIDTVLQLQKKLLEESPSERSSRPQIGESLLEKMSSGRRNFYMLGHATRAIEMTRGGREGNNALVNYDPRKKERDMPWDARRLMERDVSFATVEHLIASKDSHFDSRNFTTKIVNAVRFGHRKLAGKIAETYNSYNFNQLQIQTLLNDKQPLKKFMPVSTTKKAADNARITPFHTAAINPNVTYLKNLVEVDSNFNVPDADNWYTIHYAAVCEGPGPLEYLLKKETPLLLVNKRKETPLHSAAAAGRAENLRILVNALRSKMKEDDKEAGGESQEEDGPPPPKKTKSKVAVKDGVTSHLNAKERRGFTPLHLAKEVDVEAQCGAGGGKMTPLMMACRLGNLEIANLLIDEGHSFVDKKDKLHRTALTHATMNGQTHIVAMLLRRGADVAASTDSSGNSAVHYACAYGWLDVLELLAKADSEAFTTPNAWHLTPLSVAYLKGHFDIVDYLLNGEFKENVSVNGKDNNGSTLISAVVGSYDEISEVDIKAQVDYLLQRGADSSIVDVHLRTPLHILAKTPAVLRTQKSKNKILTIEEYLQVVDSLIDSGADILAVDNEGEIAHTTALKTGNILLSNHLFQKNTAESAKRLLERNNAEVKTDNVLHLLAALPTKVLAEWKNSEVLTEAFFDVVPFFEELCKCASHSSLVSCLSEANAEGLTPLVFLSEKISSFYDSVKFEGSDDVLVQKKQIAEQVLNVMCELVKRFIDISPEAMMNKCETKKPKRQRENGNGGGYMLGHNPWNGNNNAASDNDKTRDEGNESTCMQSALRMKVLLDSPIVEEFLLNERKFSLRNPLLKILLEKATEHQLLKTILAAKEARGHLTPLLFSIENSRDEEGRYIMYTAHRNGILKSILKDRYVKEIRENEKEKVDVTERYECSALMFAAKHELNDLIDAFSPSEDIARDEDTHGNSVMHIFAQKATPDALRHLQRFSEGDVQMKPNHDGRHPLHFAVDHLKASDTDVSTDMIDWILDQDPQSARLQDVHGRTALHYAFVQKLSKGAKAFETSQEGAKRDPIAVVSVLLKFMDKKMINIADQFGNTALHYAAFHGSNISGGVLLSKGANSEATNLQGNTALCLAVLKEHEYVTLALIQAKSDVCREVFGDTVTQSDKEQLENLWRWIPNRVVASEKLQKSIASLVVRNGWQGIIYIILDLLSKSPSTLLDLITAAVEHRKYNLLNMLLRLLQRQKTSDAVGASDVVFHFFENLQDFTSGLTEQTSAVLDQLLSRGFKLEDKSLIAVADHGGVEILDDLLEKYNAKTLLEETSTVESVLVGLIRCWDTVEHARKVKLKQWIRRCVQKVSVDSDLEFPMPAFEGMEKFRETLEKRKTTPLLWAIQHGDVSLIRYLLAELKADVNKEDVKGRTPLMVAVLWNSPNSVDAIFDPTGSTKPAAENKSSSKKQKRNSGFAAMVNGSSAMSDEEDILDQLEREIQNEETEQGEDSGREETAKKDKLEPLKLTNNDLDITKTDSANRTFVDYFVEPFGWQNVSLLDRICKTAPPARSSLKRPMERALELGQYKMVCALAKIGRFPIPQWKAVEPVMQMPSPCVHDVAADSKAFLETQGGNQMAEKKKLAPKPNENSGYAESGDLVKCPENDTLYRVLLNKSDVQYGNYGFHNFYRMEVIQRRGSSLFVLFTNWGRIGEDVGQFQRTPFSTLEEAAKEFASIFRQKTGNEWTKLSTFEEKPGKYRLVEIDDEGEADLGEIEMKLEVSKERIEHDPIYRILADMSDVRRLQERCRSLKYDYNRTLSVPFGRIDRTKILRANETLDELRVVCTEMEATRKEGGSNTNRIVRLLKEQAELSNEFYKNMPLEGFSYCRLPVIDDKDIIKRFQSCLEELFEFDVAGSLITGAITAQSRGTDPVDYIADALECRLQLLDSNSTEAQQILQNIQNSSSARVKGIYSVVSKEPTQEFAQSKLKNRKYLWHGTKSENLLSILKHGLKATPSSAVQTGQIFGEGIYFADVFAKSEKYCRASSTGSKYALLCEVALGEVAPVTNMYYYCNCEQRIESKRVNTVHVYGRQRPNEEFDLTLQNGVTMPLGTISNSDMVTLGNEESRLYMDHSEFVCKDKKNSVVRYLVEFS
ncbi:hypothetical protein QR680_005190 [Steinernema hermaphroditum]|uniref:Poly [ADP-ribose] polymerase n=1 Tax=Steinernema hermaphroditum TaxID=289476 RepID=A0AA39LUW9_9BILA|nr:hypothetical protein QR680_005190 [Steinernema hermaphroditum]